MASTENQGIFVDASLGALPRRRRRREPRARGGDAFGRVSASSLAYALLAVTVLGSVMALGTVHVTVLLVIAPLAIASAVVTLRRNADSALPRPALILFALAAYSAFQALPLPMGLVQGLHPTGASLWQETYVALGATRAWASLSLDPGASLVEALKWCCYGSVFVAAANVAGKRDARWIPGLIFTTAVAVALVVLGHRLAGAESVFGIYTPVYKASRFASSPLLNPNNLAGYLNLGAFTGIGLLLTRRVPVPSWLLALGVAVVVGLSAVSGSRAGFVALVAGTGITLALLRLKKFEGRSIPTRVLAALTLTLLAGGLLFLVGANADVWQALTEEGAKKLELISWTRPLIAEHPLTGVGRGAFETAFPAYRTDAGHHLYQFAENFVTQWMCEWGLPVAISALGALGWQLRPSRLGAAEVPSALVCCVGVLVLLAQNLLDLALELPSVSIALFTLLGGLWGGTTRAASGARTRRLPSVPHRWLVLSALSVGIWGAVALVGRHTAVSDRIALSDDFEAARGRPKSERSAALRAVGERVERAIARHPAEPFLPLLRGLVARSTRENPLPWLGQAIERDPMAGRSYLVLAEVLAQQGATAQALGAVRRAVEREYALLSRGAQLAARISRTEQDLPLAVPEGTAGASMLAALAGVPELRERRDSLLDQAAARDRKFTLPRYLRAEDFMTAAEGRSEQCGVGRGADCVARAARLLEELRELDGGSERFVILKARLLTAQGETLPALRLLAQECPIHSQRIKCLHWRVLLAQRSKRYDALDDASATYLSAVCIDSATCANAADWLGGIFTAAGHDAKALQMYERAAREQGTVRAWRQVAGAAKRLGLEGAMRRADERARRMEGSNPGTH